MFVDVQHMGCLSRHHQHMTFRHRKCVCQCNGVLSLHEETNGPDSAKWVCAQSAVFTKFYLETPSGIGLLVPSESMPRDIVISNIQRLN